MRVHSHNVSYTEPEPAAPNSQRDDALTPEEKIAPIHEALLAVYGQPTWRAHHPPLDELVLTILSQHTSDINSERAFAQLRATFPTWEVVRDAPAAAIATAIQSGGLAQSKAPRIKAVLQQIWDERGSFDL